MKSKSNLVFYLLGKQFGFNFKKLNHFFEVSQYWDINEINNYQNISLRKIIDHAYNNVPFYKESFRKLGIKPSYIQTKEDLKILPIIDKKIIIENYNDFIAKNATDFRPIERYTGGTTGSAFKYYNNSESWAFGWTSKIMISC